MRYPRRTHALLSIDGHIRTIFEPEDCLPSILPEHAAVLKGKGTKTSKTIAYLGYIHELMGLQ